MQLHRHKLAAQVWSVRWEALKALPADEVGLFLVAGQLSNEICMLAKQATFSLLQSARLQEPLQTASTAQALFATRMLAGRVNEGWRFLQKSPGWRRLQPHLPIEAQEAKRSLQTYMDTRDNLVDRLRNTVAFHTDKEVLAAAAARLDATQIIRIVQAGENWLNFFFVGSELLGAMAIAEVAGEDTYEAALRRVSDEVLEAAHALIGVTHGAMSAFLTLHGDALNAEHEEAELNVPDLRTVEAPYFVWVPPDEEWGPEMMADLKI